MKLPLSWVRDFVDIDVPAAEIATVLALRGFEVAGIETVDGDAVIDVEVTANRPDCLSITGLAREIATAFALPYRDIDAPRPGPAWLAELPVGQAPDIAVQIEAPDLCGRFAVAVATLTPCTSPDWLTSRLAKCGVRAIHPIVDVTNYVMLELGHPMHAFDRAALAGGLLRVRTATTGETLVTLDGTTRTLQADMLVVADRDHAQAVAGVMGAAASEVSAHTERIVFEAAWFLPASVRRTAKRLNLKTEASSRFERGTDPSAPPLALRRAAALLQHIGGGTITGAMTDACPHPPSPRRVGLRRTRLSQVLGMTVPDAEVARILEGLNLRATVTDVGWDVTIPTRRVDLLREVDLIEEIGRHHGYDALPPSFPAMHVATAPADGRVARDQRVRRALTAAGYSEAVTFGFVERRAAAAFLSAPDADAVVAIANPLSASFDVLRPSLLPGLLQVVAHNRRHGLPSVAVFEIGARFSTAFGERRTVGLAVTGPVTDHWSAPSRIADLFDLKGAVEQLARVFGVTLVLEAATLPGFVPGVSARILVDGQPCGVMGRVTSGVADQAGASKHDAVLLAELDLEALGDPTRTLARVAPLPRFPAVTRDISVVVHDAVTAASIHRTIVDASSGASAPLARVDVVDRYTGTGVTPEHASLSLRLTFQAADRTLTDVDVQDSVQNVVAALAEQHGAIQR